MSLAKALVAAQKEMKNPAFDSTNPHFKNKFASLASVREAVLPVLNKHGLAISQFPTAGEGVAGCRNILMHEGGEKMEYDCLLPLSKNDPQGAGSAITYARRYSLQAIAGVVAEEDDDANHASQPTAMSEKVVADYIASIQAAESMDALQKAYVAAYKGAQTAEDKKAMERLTKAKDARKDELKKAA